MERLSLAQLSNALTVTEQPSQKLLNASDGQALTALVLQMAERYPSQDLADSIEGYLWDFQQLAVRFGLAAVRESLSELRIRPGQSFFPRPDEVAEEIQHQRERQVRLREIEQGRDRKQAEITRFWELAPEMMERAGITEEQLLDRWPSFRGTKEAA